MTENSFEYLRTIARTFSARSKRLFGTPEPPFMRKGDVQTFRFIFPDETSVVYSVDLAYNLAITLRLRAGTMSLKESGHRLDWHRENYEVDDAYALTCDLSDPMIWVQIEAGTYIPIDGNHRMRKALLLGIDVLPLYVIPYPLSEACVLFRLDPGGRMVEETEEEGGLESLLFRYQPSTPNRDCV